MVASALVILWMSFAVIPGHVLNYLLLTAFSRVSCTGLNTSVYKYLMECSLPLT